MPSILAKVNIGTQRHRVVGCIAWLDLSSLRECSIVHTWLRRASAPVNLPRPAAANGYKIDVEAVCLRHGINVDLVRLNGVQGERVASATPAVVS